MTLDDIIRRTNSGIAKAMRAGMKPTEVWLGAEEMRVCKEEGDRHFPASPDLKGIMTPPTLCGLKVRESHLPGVRVGASWDGDDN